MALYSYKNISPVIGEGSYVAPSSDIIGKVFCGENCSFWFNTVIRGDVNKIEIGENVNVQDLSMLHVTEELPLIIGSGVTIGHTAVIHACTIEDNCLIGMGSVVLDGAIIGKNSVVAAGSTVPPGKKYPPYSMIMGPTGKLVRELTDKEKDQFGNHYKSYLKTKDEFINEVELIDSSLG